MYEISWFSSSSFLYITSLPTAATSTKLLFANLINPSISLSLLCMSSLSHAPTRVLKPISFAILTMRACSSNEENVLIDDVYGFNISKRLII